MYITVKTHPLPVLVAGDEGDDDKNDEDPPEDADEAEGAPRVLETGLLQFHAHHPLACMWVQGSMP
jgi:hypothetical protein